MTTSSVQIIFPVCMCERLCNTLYDVASITSGSSCELLPQTRSKGAVAKGLEEMRLEIAMHYSSAVRSYRRGTGDEHTALLAAC